MEKVSIYIAQKEQDWIGLAMFLNSVYFMESSLSVVMQIPLQKAVFKREMSNRMYHP